MPYPEDPHPVPGSNGKPHYYGREGFLWLRRRIVGWECGMCDGYGGINHRCAMVCIEDECPRCKGTGVLPLTFTLVP